MGTTLGLIGAGGSILTVPILVYFFKIPPLVATAYSLLIVGSTAFVGAISYHQKNLVNVKSAIIFTIPATLSVVFTRSLIVPNLPNQILEIPKEIFIMLLFAMLMILAATFMMRPIKIKTHQTTDNSLSLHKLIFGSAAIGFLTGMVGAGGGFLIIPTLISLFRLGMKEAIGTSLAIIATNSLIGFQGDLASGIKIDWSILSIFMALTIFGMLAGLFLSKNFDGQKLKKIFALFVIVVAISILLQETIQFINLSNL